jgi:C1A family cysteine protease
MPNHCYGYRTDLPDQRDHFYAAPHELLQALPPSVDLRSQCPPIYDQGQLGSCTAQVIAGAIEFDQMKQGKTPFMPSRLFIYYNERAMEGTVNSDAGASIRDGIKTVNSLGVCPESEWPYITAQFATRPAPQCYTDALLTRALQYQRVMQNLNMMLACLASGYPFLVGFSVYQSFESAQVAETGIVPMPQWGESILGGHCCLCIGYDNKQQRFLCRNSWGDTWGMQGYFTMPFAYLANQQLSSDFWNIRLVS